MGQNKSKLAFEFPVTPVTSAMRQKYRPESLECLVVWTSDFGFPEGGSFSLKQLGILKENLEAAKSKLFKKKTLKTESIKTMLTHEKWLTVWTQEAERRDRKKILNQTLVQDTSCLSATEEEGREDTALSLPPAAVTQRTIISSTAYGSVGPMWGPGNVYFPPTYSAPRTHTNMDTCNTGTSSSSHTFQSAQGHFTAVFPSLYPWQVLQSASKVRADLDLDSCPSVQPGPHHPDGPAWLLVTAHAPGTVPTLQPGLSPAAASQLQTVTAPAPVSLLQPALAPQQPGPVPLELSVSGSLPPTGTQQAQTTGTSLDAAAAPTPGSASAPGIHTDSHGHASAEESNRSVSEEEVILAILSGVHSEVYKRVCAAYVGAHDDPKLDDIKRHAKHAFKTIVDRKEKDDAKRQKDMHEATLSLFKAAGRNPDVTKKRKTQGRGNKKQGGQGPKEMELL